MELIQLVLEGTWKAISSIHFTDGEAEFPSGLESCPKAYNSEKSEPCSN